MSLIYIYVISNISVVSLKGFLVAAIYGNSVWLIFINIVRKKMPTIKLDRTKFMMILVIDSTACNNNKIHLFMFHFRFIIHLLKLMYWDLCALVSSFRKTGEDLARLWVSIHRDLETTRMKEMERTTPIGNNNQRNATETNTSNLKSSSV